MWIIDIKGVDMSKFQPIMGAILVFATLIFGSTLLASDALFARLLIGVGLGYVLTRGLIGFAGSVSRAYGAGSTKLMQILMLMFVLTAVINAGLLMFESVPKFDLWVNPINLGLVLGGVMFGFGMTFASCCASGVMTDLVTDLPRAAIVLLFFCMGVYLGFPLQAGKNSLSIITHSWIETNSYYGKLYHGVYLPDLFGTGVLSYVGAILLTCVFAGIVVYISKKYESKRIAEGTYTGVESEKLQHKAMQQKYADNANLVPYKFLSIATYQRLFVTPWSMKMASLMIVLIFSIMLAVSKAGWGVSAPLGVWFGQVMVFFGVPITAVAEFASRPVALFATPFFEYPISVQNFGIIVGTMICVLLMGKAKYSSRYSVKQIGTFAMGGAFMGMGTRFANGCNVGALYTPIANLSLSGWIFFVFLVAGGIMGNYVADILNTNTCVQRSCTA